MATTTIYARVQETAKSDVDDYASKHGITMTSAVQELLGLGLKTPKFVESRALLEGELAAAKKEILEATAKMQEQEALLNRTQQELDALRQAADLWAQRAEITVASCPNPDCRKPISGADLLIAGRCNACQMSTSSLFAETKASDANSRDLMLVLGAVGVLLGLLVVTGSGN